MYAQLGDIEFNLITYFNGVDDSQTYNYAQHERINNKPVLQFMGLGLQELNLKLNFHTSFCIPRDELKKLKDVAGKGTPLKFIKGNGEYIGVFVISEINSVTEQTTNEGDLVSMQVDLKLREYTGKIPAQKKKQGGIKKKK
jgi:phage protein U